MASASRQPGRSASSHRRASTPSTSSIAMNTERPQRADVVDRHHTGVREPRHRARLDEQPGARLLVAGRVRLHDLDRDVAVELRIVGRVHHAHGAAAQTLSDHVAADAPVRPQDIVIVRRGRVHAGADRGARSARQLRHQPSALRAPVDVDLDAGPGFRVEEVLDVGGRLLLAQTVLSVPTTGADQGHLPRRRTIASTRPRPVLSPSRTRGRPPCRSIARSRPPTRRASSPARGPPRAASGSSCRRSRAGPS